MDSNSILEQFNSTESYAVLFFMLIAFLFGFIVAYLLRSRRVIQLKRELRDKKKELETLQIEVTGIREQLSLKDADLQKASLEQSELEQKVQRLEQEKANLYNEVYNINAELEQAQASSKTYISTIEDLNNQIVGLKAQNAHLTEERELEDDAVDDVAQMQSVYNATRNRLETLETKLNKLENDNRSMRIELNTLKATGIPVSTVPPTRGDLVEGTAASEEEDNSEEELAFIPNKDKGVLGDKIILEEPEKDDLSLITGIGPFLEKKLNEIGIYTYLQISEMTPGMIEQVTKDIGYLPGRIEKDDWVGQATRLYQAKQEDPLALQPLDTNSNSPEDLKIIEGIGPKIEELLKAANINSWKDLADTEPEKLRQILDAAGDHYRVHDPGTWPAQARLAANGEWELLKEYQEELKGGRPAE